MYEMDRCNWKDHWHCEVYIYKGYGPVGPLIISYHHDMRVIQGLMIISALTYYHCNRVHIDIMVLDNIDKKDKKN